MLVAVHRQARLRSRPPQDPHTDVPRRRRPGRIWTIRADRLPRCEARTGRCRRRFAASFAPQGRRRSAVGSVVTGKPSSLVVETTASSPTTVSSEQTARNSNSLSAFAVHSRSVWAWISVVQKERRRKAGFRETRTDALEIRASADELRSRGAIELKDVRSDQVGLKLEALMPLPWTCQGRELKRPVLL